MWESILFLLFQRPKKKKGDAARFLDARGDEKQVINLERLKQYKVVIVQIKWSQFSKFIVFWFVSIKCRMYKLLVQACVFHNFSDTCIYIFCEKIIGLALIQEK